MLMRKRVEIKMYIVLGLIFAPVIVSSAVLSSDYVSADESAGVNASVNVPASCTMSGSGTSSHTATLINGTYTPGIGTTTVNVTCNDAAGFSIYAAGFTGNVVGGTNSNKLVGTAASSNATIDTGTATGPGYDDESNWAMKLDTDYYAEYPITIVDNYDYYSEVPNSYTKVATRLTGTDAGTGATGASLTTTYAAYISKVQPTDTYAGQVKYVLVHPNTVTPPATGSVDFAFFDAGKDKYNGYYRMQDMNAAICASISNEQSGILIDQRDDNTYIVTKIAGRCWMTQNLRFTGTNLDPSTSNVESATTITYGDLTSGNSFNQARIHSGADSAGNPSVWYNFAAASAMTVNSGTGMNSTYDVCPAGWRLPTYSETAGIPPHLGVFNLVTGGRFGDSQGEVTATDKAFWWSSTTYDNWSGGATRHYAMKWDGSSLGTYEFPRYDGMYIRCISDPAPTMQEQTTSSLAVVMPNQGDSTTLKDVRDGKIYEVTKINDQYWMTENLRFTGTDLDPSTSNVEIATTMTYGDLTSGNSYDEARIRVPYGENDVEIRIWYNYAAATAMTVTGDSNDTDATQDICPAGWRLPTYDEGNGVGSKLSYRTAFKPVTGGYYRNANRSSTNYGYWWTADTSSLVARYDLRYNGPSTIDAHSSHNRDDGVFIRCVKK